MQSNKPNNRLSSKRRTRSMIFLILTGVFLVYIILYPDYWIFSSLMAVLSLVGWFTNRQLSEDQSKGNQP